LYRITVTTAFRAAHQLSLSGTTEPQHSHDWQVEAAICGKKLDDNGLLFDFNELKKILDDIVGQFKDRKLEDCPCFKGRNTSAENVAEYIYKSIKPLLPKRIKLLFVEVTETLGCRARYGK
jgi:6-pyruvoyltetrahydropterin/6-carboxytetrahydropterin synthase